MSVALPCSGFTSGCPGAGGAAPPAEGVFSVSGILSGRPVSWPPLGLLWGSRTGFSGFGLGVGCWSGGDTGPRSTGFSGCGRTGFCPMGFWGPCGRPCGCSRGTCAGFPRSTGAPGSTGGRCVGRDTGPRCTPSPRTGLDCATGDRGSTWGAPTGSRPAVLGRAGRPAGRDASPPFAGSPRTGCSTRRGTGLDRATGAVSGSWPANRWGGEGSAGSGTLAGSCARDALSAHNNMLSVTRTQVAARTHGFRTATLTTPRPPSVE